ncbi:hypothetical protein PTI98_010944 [Pleurotus ostreatus]|nr:hypothetical protein PTI98_010944 [Pleurotus ostreatus]
MVRGPSGDIMAVYHRRQYASTNTPTQVVVVQSAQPYKQIDHIHTDGYSSSIDIVVPDLLSTSERTSHDNRRIQMDFRKWSTILSASYRYAGSSAT